MKFLARKADRWKESQLGTVQKQIQIETSQETVTKHAELKDQKSRPYTNDPQLQTKSSTNHLCSPEGLENFEPLGKQEERKSNSKTDQRVAQQLFSYNFEPLRKKSDCQSKAPSMECEEAINGSQLVHGQSLTKQKRQNSAPVFKPVVQKVLGFKGKANYGSFVQPAVSKIEITPRDLSSVCQTTRTTGQKRTNSMFYHTSEDPLNNFPFRKEIADTVSIQKVLNGQKANAIKMIPVKPNPEQKRVPISVLVTSKGKDKPVSEIGAASHRRLGQGSVQIPKNHPILEQAKQNKLGPSKKKLFKPDTNFQQRFSKQSSSSRGSSAKNLRKLSDFDMKSLPLKKKLNFYRKLESPGSFKVKLKGQTNI